LRKLGQRLMATYFTPNPGLFQAIWGFSISE
jgi:hypothetical protein